jgi:hypothetical protein
VNSAAALAARAGYGSLALDWPLIGAFTAAAMIGALAGSGLAGRPEPRRLCAAFTALIVIGAGYTQPPRPGVTHPCQIPHRVCCHR